MKKPCATLLPVAVALLASYTAVYFASVLDGQFMPKPEPRYMRTYTASSWSALPYYRGFPGPVQGLAQWGFAPAHYLDRHLFRPAKWAGRIRLPAIPAAPAKPLKRPRPARRARPTGVPSSWVSL